jgi:hypothetical protein
MKTKLMIVAALMGAAAMSAHAGFSFNLSLGLPVIVSAPPPVVYAAPAAPPPAVCATPVVAAPEPVAVVQTVLVSPAPGYVWVPGYWAGYPASRVWVRGSWCYRSTYVAYGRYHGGWRR